MEAVDGAHHRVHVKDTAVAGCDLGQIGRRFREACGGKAVALGVLTVTGSAFVGENLAAIRGLFDAGPLRWRRWQ